MNATRSARKTVAPPSGIELRGAIYNRILKAVLGHGARALQDRPSLVRLSGDLHIRLADRAGQPLLGPLNHVESSLDLIDLKVPCDEPVDLGEALRPP
jgi:hypothetical protein